MGTSKTAARKIKALMVERDAVALRCAGHSISQIAEKIGVGASTVHKAIKRAMAKLEEDNKEPTERLRQLYITRYSTMLSAIWDRATGAYKIKGKRQPADLKAIERAVNLIEHLADLQGVTKLQLDQAAGDGCGYAELVAVLKAHGISVTKN